MRVKIESHYHTTGLCCSADATAFGTCLIHYPFLREIPITGDSMRCDLRFDTVRIMIPSEAREKSEKKVTPVTDRIFWNSSTGNLHIESRLAGKMAVYDLSGRILFTCTITKGKQYISLKGLSRNGGLRIVRISTSAGNAHQLLRF